MGVEGQVNLFLKKSEEWGKMETERERERLRDSET